MKRILAAVLAVLLLAGIASGCHKEQGVGTEPTASRTTPPTEPSESVPQADLTNVLWRKNMTPEMKEAFIRFRYEQTGRASPFIEDGFGYGLFYLGTINGWDIIYRQCDCMFFNNEEFNSHPDMKLGDIQFEGSCKDSFEACKPSGIKRLIDVYEAGEIGDEPLPDLLVAYKAAYKRKQTITQNDIIRGDWAFAWLHWDLVGKGNKFPWRYISKEALPWGLLPDEVIEGRLQPDEWTEEKPQP